MRQQQEVCMASLCASWHFEAIHENRICSRASTEKQGWKAFFIFFNLIMERKITLFFLSREYKIIEHAECITGRGWSQTFFMTESWRLWNIYAWMRHVSDYKWDEITNVLYSQFDYFDWAKIQSHQIPILWDDAEPDLPIWSVCMCWPETQPALSRTAYWLKKINSNLVRTRLFVDWLVGWFVSKTTQKNYGIDLHETWIED